MKSTAVFGAADSDDELSGYSNPFLSGMQGWSPEGTAHTPFSQIICDGYVD